MPTFWATNQGFPFFGHFRLVAMNTSGNRPILPGPFKFPFNLSTAADQAEVISRNTAHATFGPPFSRVLLCMYWLIGIAWKPHWDGEGNLRGVVPQSTGGRLLVDGWPKFQSALLNWFGLALPGTINELRTRSPVSKITNFITFSQILYMIKERFEFVLAVVYLLC